MQKQHGRHGGIFNETVAAAESQRGMPTPLLIHEKSSSKAPPITYCTVQYLLPGGQTLNGTEYLRDSYISVQSNIRSKTIFRSLKVPCWSVDIHERTRE